MDDYEIIKKEINEMTSNEQLRRKIRKRLKDTDGYLCDDSLMNPENFPEKDEEIITLDCSLKKEFNTISKLFEGSKETNSDKDKPEN